MFEAKSVDFHHFICCLLLSDDNKVKMARKPGKKQKENPVGCTRKDEI